MNFSNIYVLTMSISINFNEIIYNVILKVIRFDMKLNHHRIKFNSKLKLPNIYLLINASSM